MARQEIANLRGCKKPSVGSSPTSSASNIFYRGPRHFE